MINAFMSEIIAVLLFFPPVAAVVFIIALTRSQNKANKIK
jgi:hypothetical protein